MTTYLKKTMLALLLTIASSNITLAASDDVAVPETIINKLKSARSDLTYTYIGDAPINSFHEVQIEDGPIIYVSSDGDFFFDGTLYQINVGQFVDAQNVRLNGERKNAFASLSADDMLIFSSNSSTKAIINVFTDIDCGYCRKLHREVPELNRLGIEVRYLAFPRAGINSASYDKIATAWCSNDPQESLTRFKNGQDDPVNVCDDNPVTQHYDLGKKLGVTGTPAIVLMDGTLIPGYKKAGDIAKILGIES